MKNIIIVIVIAIFLIGVGYYFVMNKKQSPIVNESDVNMTGKTLTFNITARQFAFEPSTLSVNRGDTVIINVTSTDVAHGLAIDEYGINETINGGETKQIKFVADKTGEFILYCSVMCGAGHRDMTGKLIVANQAKNPVINDTKKIMNLSGQGLSKLPSMVLENSALEELDVSNNNLTGALPSQIGQLRNLKKLNASNNQMTGIPAEIGQLTKLEELNYSGNQITGLPNEIANLKNLRVFNLSGNQYSVQDLVGIKRQLPGLVVVGE